MDLSEDGNVDFKVNEDYARKYNTWRRKEEIQKYKDRYGEGVSDDESSSSESEDEDAEGLTPQIEKDFLKTLSIIRSKDPKLYQQEIKFFKDEDEDETEEQTTARREGKRSDKPLYLKDYERKIMVEREGKFTDDAADEDEWKMDERSGSPTYMEEQQQIKDSFYAAVHDDSDDETEGLLTVKPRSEEQEQLEARLQRKRDDDSWSSETDALQQLWTDPALDEGEKFLRDYIMNKGYIDKDPSGLKGFKIDSDNSEDDDDVMRPVDDADFSEEERMLEEQEEFERKFNFRFEEPDSDFIKRYPRTVAETVRRKDDKRAKKRVEKKSRQEEVKQKKQEELKQLKNLKKQEIFERLEKLKEVTGNEKIGFDIDDLEGDFDPQEHDRLMQKVFSGEYDAQAEDVKPHFDDEEYGDENWDEWKRGEDEEGYHDNGGEYGGEDDVYYDDSNFNMDADYQEEIGEDEGQGSSHWELAEEMLGASKKKKKKMSMFAKSLMKKKPVFNPEDKSFEDYIEEYYRLDYEDMIGDQPCRFKYRNVEANDFGLTTEEILRAKEKELNQWASLKKTCQYRSEEEERKDKEQFKKMGQNVSKKRRIFLSLLEEGDTEDSEDNSPQMKAKQKEQSGDASSSSSTRRVETVPKQNKPVRSRKRRKMAVEQKQGQPAKSSGERNERITDQSSQKDRTGGRDKTGKGKTEEKGRTDDKTRVERTIGEKKQNGKDALMDKTASSVSSKEKRRERKKMILSKLKEMRSRKKVKRLSGGGVKSRAGAMRLSDTRLRAYGFNPSKQRYRMKHGNNMKR